MKRNGAIFSMELLIVMSVILAAVTVGIMKIKDGITDNFDAAASEIKAVRNEFKKQPIKKEEEPKLENFPVLIP